MKCLLLALLTAAALGQNSDYCVQGGKVRYPMRHLNNSDSLTLPNICVKCDGYIYGKLPGQTEKAYDIYYKSNHGVRECKSILDIEGAASTDMYGFPSACIEPYIIDNKKCKIGVVENCIKYSESATRCQTCADGYYRVVDEYYTQCKQCAVHCTLCGAEPEYKCLRCDSGYFLKEENSSCQECTVRNCTICNPKGECSACASGYQLLDTLTECFTCGVANCVTCSTVDGEKSKCKMCHYGYHLTSNATCEPCLVVNCNSCYASKETCSVCAPDFYLTTETTCEKCKVSNCEVCNPINVNKCRTCKEGYFWKDNGAKCAKCSASHCEICDPTNNSRCWVCETGYVPTSGVCTPIECDDDLHCKCDTTNHCLECRSGYTFQDANHNSCVLSPTAHCALASDRNDVCEDCEVGYFLTEFGKCMSCNDSSGFVRSNHCVACSLQKLFYNDSYMEVAERWELVCDECEIGYTLGKTGLKCIKCSNHCLQCDFNRNCLYCDDGYDLQPNHTCIKHVEEVV